MEISVGSALSSWLWWHKYIMTDQRLTTDAELPTNNWKVIVISTTISSVLLIGVILIFALVLHRNRKYMRSLLRSKCDWLGYEESGRLFYVETELVWLLLSHSCKAVWTETKLSVSMESGSCTWDLIFVSPFIDIVEHGSKSFRALRN